MITVRSHRKPFLPCRLQYCWSQLLVKVSPFNLEQTHTASEAIHIYVFFSTVCKDWNLSGVVKEIYQSKKPLLDSIKIACKATIRIYQFGLGVFCGFFFLILQICPKLWIKTGNTFLCTYTFNHPLYSHIILLAKLESFLQLKFWYKWCSGSVGFFIN